MAEHVHHIPEAEKVYAQPVQQFHQGIPVQQAVQAQPVYYQGQPQQAHYMAPPSQQQYMQPPQQQYQMQQMQYPQQQLQLQQQQSGTMPGTGFCQPGRHVWGPSRPSSLAWIVCITTTIFLFPVCCALFMCTTKECQVCHLSEEKNC